MSRFASFLRISALGIGLLAVASARANTINVMNGGFESTLTNNTSQFGSEYSSQQVTGWQGNGYAFVFLPGTADTTGTPARYGGFTLWGPGSGSNNGLGASPDGGNYLGFDGGFDNGSASQLLTGLTPGALTTVSFWYAGVTRSGFDGDSSEGFDVTLGDQTLSTASVFTPSHGFSGWQQANLGFIATSTSEQLSFLAHGTPTGVPPFTLLDGVTVQDTVTPEPNSLALLGTGVLSLGGLIRRRYLKA